MRQFKPFTKIILACFFMGALLTLTGFLAGGWDKIKDLTEQYRQPQVVDFDQITSIEVQGNITIMPSSTNKIKLHYYRDQHKGIDLTSYQVKERTLTLQDREEGFLRYNGLLELVLGLANKKPDEAYQAILYLPKNSSFDQLTGVIQGDLYLDKISIQKLNLTVDQGQALIQDSQIDAITLFQTAGDLTLNSTTLRSQTDITENSDSSIRVDNGDILAENLQLEGRHDMSTTAGSITISLHPKTKNDIYIDIIEDGYSRQVPEFSDKNASNYLQLHTDTETVQVR